MKNKEGWTWLTNSKKWHYFRDGRSLCGRFAILSAELEQGNDNSPDNCVSCKKKLAKEKTAQQNVQRTAEERLR